MYHHCGAPMDSVKYTLLECPAWEGACLVLMDALRLDEEEEELSLNGMIRTMLSGAKKCEAAISFCEEVILWKEDVERKRERAPDATSTRRNRGRGKAWSYARAP